MPSKVVVGVQWGDEGKGKTIDMLAQKSDVVVRSQGGNNAGHTVAVGDEVYKLHLIPSGILYKHTTNLIGAGTVIDPKSLLLEIDGLKSRGISCENLNIDPRAHVIMPWHLELDSLSEEARGDSNLGTTRRGIGPCYMDKSERSGIRIYDLTNPDVFKEKARVAGDLKNNIITKLYGKHPLDIEAIIDEYTALGKRLAPYVADVSVITYNAYKEGKQILFEGAQGAMLDLDMGTYPFVTSSHPIAAGACIGAGIGPGILNDIIGVAKSYTTRVGTGPFPTELLDSFGDELREKGHEFGTTTGRPRRVGWFDSVVLRHSVRTNGLTEIVINKLDTLCGLGDLKVCTAYKKADGTVIRDFPPTIEELAECSPIYETVPGFDGDIFRAKDYSELPQSCKDYIDFLEKVCECRISMVGTGPARNQLLAR